MVRTADTTLRPFRRNLRRRFSQSCAVPSFRLSTTFCPGTPCGVLSCMLKQPFKWRYSDHAFNCYYSRFSISISGRWRPAGLLVSLKSRSWADSRSYCPHRRCMVGFRSGIDRPIAVSNPKLKTRNLQPPRESNPRYTPA